VPLFEQCVFVICVFVLRDAIRWEMHKFGVEEWLVLVVMSMYTGAKTVVRTVYCNSKFFKVTVVMHRGSALSPLLFMIVMEAMSTLENSELPYHGMCHD